MERFQNLGAEEWNPLFEKIGTEWMLIGADNGETANPMTASWGGFGILWNRPVAFCFIRPQRFTDSLLQSCDRFSLSFLGERYRDILRYCGKVSGRDHDKFLQTGLTPIRENGYVYPAQASAVILCHQLYAQFLDPNCFLEETLSEIYDRSDTVHRMWIGEIRQILCKRELPLSARSDNALPPT